MKLIVEMEMPLNCKKCPLVRMDHFGQIRCEGQGDRLIHLKNFQTEIERPSWCPIKGVLPETHGRLIDEAVFCENVVKYSHQSTKTIGKALDATPTIIEMTPIVAERSET